MLFIYRVLAILHVTMCLMSLVASTTPLPTEQPVYTPTLQPTSYPSMQPSSEPTSTPSAQPSGYPSSQPSSQPSFKPTSQPSSQPSNSPTVQPSLHPSSQPSERPSMQPTSQPSSSPSTQPTSQPTSIPSTQATSQPSTQPSAQPTGHPSVQPSDQPSAQPSSQPSSLPSVQPVMTPSAQPSSQPSSRPSAQPSTQPSLHPSCQPTSVPTSQPSMQPSSRPSSQPSNQPSTHPSALPTVQPSARPSMQPSTQPSSQPTMIPTQPTSQPTMQPSSMPSAQPSGQPSAQPSSQPSSFPSTQPSAVPSTQPTNQPSVSPTVQPSSFPTSEPSTQPSSKPSSQPSCQPTSEPTNPTSQPTQQPTAFPSGQPSMRPSSQPTQQPTDRPSTQPTSYPSAQPSMQPSVVPSGQPSMQPTSIPTMQPSTQPTSLPTAQPSSQPSQQPVMIPTSQPSTQPSNAPSTQPTCQPSVEPTGQPSSQPTMAPSCQPSSHPSSRPSSQPSMKPSMQPSAQPSMKPSSQPSTSPTTVPSNQPTSRPSSQPSSQPTNPTACPSSQPSQQPSQQPTGQPSRQPTRQPTTQPSRQPTSQPSRPTSHPTPHPSPLPTPSPTRAPTFTPSYIPTVVPSVTKPPTFTPSAAPSYSMRPTAIPTVSPTRGPTFSLSPTRAPTIAPTAIVFVLPVFNTTRVLVTAASSRSISITASFIQAANYAGKVACAAYSLGKVPPSVSSVLQSAFSVSYVAGIQTVQLTIGSGLVSLTSYSVYCAIQGIDLASSTYANVLATGRNVTTLCCKTVAFSANPTYIYNDVSLYSRGIFPPVTFTYALEAAPSSSAMIASVTLKNVTNGEAVNSSWYSISPSTKTFTVGTTSLSTSFVVSFLKINMTTNVSVAVSFVGASISEYDVSSKGSVLSLLQVKTFDATKMPPPQIKNVIMGDSGTIMYVNLDSASNRAGMTSVVFFPCSRLLSFEDVASTSCLFVNTSSIYVSFGSRRTLEIGGSVTLLSSKLRASCSNLNQYWCALFPNNTQQTVTVLDAYNPVLPIPIVSVPSLVNPCQSFYIDPSLSWGYAGKTTWKNVQWNVSTDSSSALSAASYLQGLLQATTSGRTSTRRSLQVGANTLALGNFFVTLTLKNSLDAVSSRTSTFTYGGQANTPLINIIGSTERTIYSRDSLFIQTNGTLSSCVGSSLESTLGFTWTLYDTTATGGSYFEGSSTVVSSVISSSNNPRSYLLAPYSLTTGNIYTVEVSALVSASGSFLPATTATATITISVLSGSVVARIQGGSIQKISEDRTLDGSSSYDENGTPLSYLWSCQIASFANFGQDCAFIFNTKSGDSGGLTANSVDVDFERLRGSEEYQVILTVTGLASSDNSGQRVAASSIRLSGLNLTSSGVSSNVRASTRILVDDTTINYDRYLVLTGFVQSPTASTLYATWSASQEEATLSLTENNLALTATNVTIPSILASSGITFQLKLFAGQLTIGGTTTFSLSVFSSPSYASSALLGFAAVDISINGPPSGGVVTSVPKTGYAFTTSFYFSTTDWEDDASSSLPLTYDFRYIVPPSTPFLFIQAQSPAASATTLLPNGQDAFDHAVRVYVRAYDVYQANATISTVVNVTLSSESSTSSLISVDLARALNISNYNAALLVANNLASYLGQVNCSGATPSFCYTRHRSPCATTPNTCGNCLTGYEGVSGPSNLACYADLNSVAIGGACSKNSDCIYRLCSNETKTCTAPMQSCPSDCSGHGTCSYFTPTGLLIASSSAQYAECTVINSNCIAQCVCDEGYGGLFGDCSTSTANVATQVSFLDTVCQTIVTASNFSDISSQLLESLASTLVTTSSAFVGLSTTSSICQEALSVVTALSSDGQFISNAEYDVTANLLFSISNFVKPPTEDSSEYYSSSSDSSSFVSDRLSSVLRGMIGAMANGEVPVTVNSARNIQVQTRRDLATDFANISVAFPQTQTASSFSSNDTSLMPKVEFVGGSGMYCSNTAGYVRFAAATWSQNPFISNEDPEVANTTTSAVYRTEVYPNPFEPIPDNLNTNNVMYYYTVPFTSTQSFEYTSLEAKLWNPGVNYTIPACTEYNPNTGEFQSCNNCEISTYTNTSVTYACYDIRNICGKPGSTQPVRSTSSPSQQPVVRPTAPPTQMPTRTPTLAPSLSSNAPAQQQSVSSSPSRAPLSFSPTSAPKPQEQSLSSSPTSAPKPQQQFLSAISSASNSAEDEYDEYTEPYTLPSSIQSWLSQQQQIGSARSTAADLVDTTSAQYRALVSLTGDDDGSELDTSNANVQQVAALLQAITNTFVLIISNNPFNINVAEAKGVIAFVSLLFIGMVSGTVLFLRWDRSDYYFLTYGMMHGVQVPPLVAREKKKFWKKQQKQIAAAGAIARDGSAATGGPSDAFDYHHHAAQLVYERLASKHKSGLAYAVHMLTPLAFADLPPPPATRPASTPLLLAASKRQNSEDDTVEKKEKEIEMVGGSVGAVATGDESVDVQDVQLVLEKEKEKEKETEEGLEGSMVDSTLKDDATAAPSPNMESPGVLVVAASTPPAPASASTLSPVEDKPTPSKHVKPQAAAVFVGKPPPMSARARALYDIKSILDTAIPISARLWKLRGWRGIWEMLSQNHTLSTMFYKPSMANSRSMRWMSLCMDIGLLLFFDTLFFGIFFADVGTCQAQLTEETCLAHTNHATGLSLCTWDGYPGFVQYADQIYTTNGTCSLQGPPGTLTFTLLLAALSLIFALPFELLFDVIRVDVLNKEPDWVDGSAWKTGVAGCRTVQVAIERAGSWCFDCYQSCVDLPPTDAAAVAAIRRAEQQSNDCDELVSMGSGEDLEVESAWEVNRRRLQHIVDQLSQQDQLHHSDNDDDDDDDEKKSDAEDTKEEDELERVLRPYDNHQQQIDPLIAAEIKRLRRIVIKRTKVMREFFKADESWALHHHDDTKQQLDLTEELLHARMSFFHASGDTNGEIDFLLRRIQLLMEFFISYQVQHSVIGHHQEYLTQQRTQQQQQHHTQEYHHELQHLHVGHHPLPHHNHNHHYYHHRNPVHTSLEIKAMERMLGIHIDGSSAPMTALESWLMFYHPLECLREHRWFQGCFTNKSSVQVRQEAHNSWYRKVMRRKLDTARRASDEIVKAIEEIPVNYTWQQDQNIALIRYFVLEQFTPFKRYVLEYRLFPIDSALPGKVNPFAWLFGWFFYVFWLLFFLVWIFQWGTSSGKAAFRAWGINFVLVVIQELLFAQIVLILVMYLIAMYAIEPQLLAIYRTLYRKAIDIIVHEHPPAKRPSSSSSSSPSPAPWTFVEEDDTLTAALIAADAASPSPSSLSSPFPVASSSSSSPTATNPSEHAAPSPGRRMHRPDFFQRVEDDILYASASGILRADGRSSAPRDNDDDDEDDEKDDGACKETKDVAANDARGGDGTVTAAAAAVATTTMSPNKQQQLPFYLIQYISPACRAAYRPLLSPLISAKILRSMTGADMELCKLMEHKPLHLVVLYFVAIPVLLGMFGQEIASIVISATVPTSLYLFIVVNYYIAKGSVAAIVLLYVGCFTIGWWRREVERHSRRTEQHHRATPRRRDLDVLSLRRSLSSSRRLSAPEVLAHYLRRAYTAVLIAMPVRVYLALGGHLVRRVECVASQWNAMNLPTALQCYDASPGDGTDTRMMMAGAMIAATTIATTMTLLTETETKIAEEKERERGEEETRREEGREDAESSDDGMPREIEELRHASWSVHVDKRQQPRGAHPLLHQPTEALPARYFPTPVSPYPCGMSGYLDVHVHRLRRRYRVLRHNRSRYARATAAFDGWSNALVGRPRPVPTVPSPSDVDASSSSTSIDIDPPPGGGGVVVATEEGSGEPSLDSLDQALSSSFFHLQSTSSPSTKSPPSPSPSPPPKPSRESRRRLSSSPRSMSPDLSPSMNRETEHAEDRMARPSKQQAVGVGTNTSRADVGNDDHERVDDGQREEATMSENDRTETAAKALESPPQKPPRRHSSAHHNDN